MSNNLSGEPSGPMERKGDLASTKKATGDEPPVSMSFIRRILDTEDKLDREESRTKIDISNVDLDKARGVSFTGVDSVGSGASSAGDEDKDREELINKIQTLKLDLKQAKLDKSAEKTMNRKKDRNLVKLAKELNRRGEEIKAKDKEMNELTATVATLEAKLAANKTELQERVTTNEKQTREHSEKVAELAEEQRKLWKEHQTKIAGLQDQHIKASEEHVDRTDRMRKEILASNRTIQSLRDEVARLGSEEKADKIVDRGMTAPLTRSDIPIKKLSTKEKVLRALSVAFIVLVGVGYKLDLLSLNAMCAPVRPGTTLSEGLTSEAPWWAPTTMKSGTFVLCGKRPRTLLSWTVGKPGNNVLSVTNLDGDESLLQKKLASAVVHSGTITTTDKKGGSDDIKAPWTL